MQPGIGQGFAIVGMAIAKASLGFFLLRLVTIFWHRVAIWSMMGLVMAASIGEFGPFWEALLVLTWLVKQHRCSASGSPAFPSNTCTTGEFLGGIAPSTPDRHHTFSAVRIPAHTNMTEPGNNRR